MSATADSVAIKVPDIGDFGEVPVIEVFVAVGDTVAVEDPLLTLESDKATMDVPSPAAGLVKAVHVKVGDKVAEGALILDLEPAGGDAPQERPHVEDTPEAIPPAQQQDTPATPAAQTTPSSAAAPTPAGGGALGGAASGSGVESGGGSASANGSHSNGDSGPVYASPAVRRIARELGVDLHGVHGTGRKGRLIPEDVRTAGKGAGAPGAGGVPTNGSAAGLGLAPWPVVDFEKFGPIERVERTRIQKISAPALARNWVLIPHVTHNDEADITELEAWRKQLNAELGKDGVKFTMLSFLIAASVSTLKAFPTVNASLDGEDLVLRRYYNIGFAADTPGGLVVPVIKNADSKGLIEIATDLGELSAKAREGKLGPGEMNGGTFTISSLGGIGGTSFTPIINAPEVAILGVTRSAVKPIWDEASGSFQPRLMLPLSLSYDHRVIDGATAARFVVHLVKTLTDLRRVLL
jgi:pyruvate dehydrogenase E2 component (dihydrolipoamide acetyltransferase)